MEPLTIETVALSRRFGSVTAVSELGLQVATYLSYALGPGASWMTTSSWFVALASAVVLTLMVVASAIGLIAIPIYTLLATAEFALRSVFDVGALVPLMDVSAFGRGYLHLLQKAGK